MKFIAFYSDGRRPRHEIIVDAPDHRTAAQQLFSEHPISTDRRINVEAQGGDHGIQQFQASEFINEATRTPTTSAGFPPSPPSAKDSPYYGYGGWLAFFCIVQILIAPLLALISGAVSLSVVGDVSDRYPSLLTLTLVEVVGDIGVVCFGVVTGLKLRRLRHGAVSFAKGYLIARLLWAVLTLGLPAMGSDLPSQVTGAMMAEAVKGLVQAILAFAIWFSYFNISKRIKATFPEG